MIIDVKEHIWLSIVKYLWVSYYFIDICKMNVSAKQGMLEWSQMYLSFVNCKLFVTII